MMISLSDAQLKVVMAAASQVPIENHVFAADRAALQRRGRRFDDGEIAKAVQQALTGLIQQPAA